MEVPVAFIEWWTEFATSNVDLARLSNVNRAWRRIVIRALLEQAQKKDNNTLLLLPSMIRAILSEDTAIKQGGNDTFCAAWFHPAGIQIQQMAVVDDVWEHEAAGSGGMFAPSGVPFYEGSEEEQLTGRFGIRTIPRRGRTPHRQEGPLCSHEWQGYREAIDVLEPFGFAPYFVEVRNCLVLLCCVERQE